MEGKGTPAHVEFLAALNCDVLLLTEVPHGLDLGGGEMVRTGTMGAGARKDWAAVWTASALTERESGHSWSAAAEADGTLFVSTVLPWNLVRASGHWPGPEATTGERVAASLAQVAPLLQGHDGPVVWGGDLNHALEGREYAGAEDGRAAIAGMVGELGLVVPTAPLPHRDEGRASIDHVAVPAGWDGASAERTAAQRADGPRLSDHDAYVVEARRGANDAPEHQPRV